MSRLLSILLGGALLGVAGQVSGTASKSALFSQGLSSVCSLSGDLKGVGKYVKKELESVNLLLEKIQEAADALRMNGLKKGGNCQTMAVLENYMRLKGRRLRKEWWTAAALGLTAAVENGYAGGRIDEFFYEFAGMNTGETLSGSQNSCFVKGGSSEASAAITPSKGKDDSNVGLCFKAPGDVDASNLGEGDHFQKHLSAKQTGDNFLTTSAPNSAGCLVLTTGSSHMFIGSNGPAHWFAAGGLIKFVGGSNLDSSFIQAHGTLLSGGESSSVFVAARDTLGSFNSKMKTLKAEVRSAFSERSSEEINEDNEFKRALYLSAVVDRIPETLSSQHVRIYDSMIKEYEKIEESQSRTEIVEKLEAENRRRTADMCTENNGTSLQTPHGAQKVPRESTTPASSHTSPQVISQATRGPSEILRIYCFPLTLLLL